MAASHYVLHHEVLGTGTAETGWSKKFATLDEARRTADEQWWTADTRAVRQTIANTANGEELVRRFDGVWITVPKKSHLRG